ncbi:MAG: metalloregulator ArsR/SmtB family transcription factor [Candidatus Thiodiazotropha sp. (ex Epidulcina cf. delphinae)]|nr:metalloregulator ArsR/SmtB family transcription factor [Candidatus Thiodiazotropha sp. (ex Epidulcina cf. delphinae)]
MVYYREQPIDQTFFALAHPVRRAVLERLAEGDRTVADVSAGLGESPSQMTKHLQILERAALLTRHKVGRFHQLHFEPKPLEDAMDWIIRHRQFWESKFDALEAYLHDLSEGK